MILLDTNVLIYGFDPGSPYYEWARDTIAGAAAGDGAAINVVSLAELCVGERHPSTAAERVRSWGVEILDLPVAAAEVCAAAYATYRERRRAESGGDSPRVPLPDFFIGAHAVVLGCWLATADTRRFTTAFPAVVLVSP